MAKNQVRIGVGVKDNATKPINGIRDAFNRLQKQGAKGFAIGAGAAITAKGFSLLEGAASSVIDTLGDSVAAYREDQVSVSKLNQALLANVKGFNGNTDAIEANLKAGMRLGFADELQRDALTGLVAAYGDQQQALKSLTLAQDIARFSGMGLAEASDLLVKVHAGSFRSLRELGIETKGVKSETEALGLIYDKVKGQAAAYAETSQGKIVAANLAIGESQEGAGKALDRFWGHVAEVAAEAIDSEYAHQALVARLEKLSNDELERLANERLLTAAGTDKKIAASAVLLARQMAETYGDMTGQIVGFGRTGSRSLEDLERAEADAEQEARDFAQAIKDAGDAAEQSKRQFDKTTDQIDLLAAALFGGAQKTGELAEAKKDLNDLLKEGPETKSAQDIAIWKGKVAEAREALFLLQLAMARADGPAALQAFLLDVIETTVDADVAVRALAQSILNTNEKYIALLAMANAAKDDVFIPTPQTGNTRGFSRGGPEVVGGLAGKTYLTNPPDLTPTRAFASGGFLPTGGTGTVGEEGIEQISSVPGGTVITPTSTPSGTVITPTSPPGGGTTNIINLTVQGDVRARSKEDVVRELIRAAAFIR